MVFLRSRQRRRRCFGRNSVPGEEEGGGTRAQAEEDLDPAEEDPPLPGQQILQD